MLGTRTKELVPRMATCEVKQGYMLETPSMLKYEIRDNLIAADNQQGRPEMEPSTTTRLAPNWVKI